MNLRTLIPVGLAAAALAVAPVAGAQGDRAQMINRVIDGINSADPVVRLVTLEEAMASRDRNLQRVAIAAAFASADLVLRTAAIEAQFGLKSTFSIELTGLAPGTKDRAVIDRSGGKVDVWVRGFDAATGGFEAHSNVSYHSNVKNDYEVKPGNLSGDRLSFSLNAYQLGSNGCTVSAAAEAGSPVMTGVMTCDIGGARHAYTIRIDLLR